MGGLGGEALQLASNHVFGRKAMAWDLAGMLALQIVWLCTEHNGAIQGSLCCNVMPLAGSLELWGAAV